MEQLNDENYGLIDSEHLLSIKMTAFLYCQAISDSFVCNAPATENFGGEDEVSGNIVGNVINDAICETSYAVDYNNITLSDKWLTFVDSAPALKVFAEDTPVITQKVTPVLDKGVVSWAAQSQAEYYLVRLDDGEAVKTEALSVDLKTYTWSGTGLHTLYVMVCNDDYAKGEWAEMEFNVYSFSVKSDGIEKTRLYQVEGAQISLAQYLYPKEGYTATGFKDAEGNDYQKDGNAVLTGDLELSVQYTVNPYTVHYYTMNPDGSWVKIESKTLDFGTELIYPEPKVEGWDPAGYEFAGWYVDEGLQTENIYTTVPAHELSLYAKFVRNEFSLMAYTNNGESQTTIEVPYYTVVTEEYLGQKLGEVSYFGYTFAGWYADEALSTPFAEFRMGVNSVQIYAKWTLNSHEIVTDAQGGSYDGDIPSAFTVEDGSLVLPAAEKYGYTFHGWSVNGGDDGLFEIDCGAYDENIYLCAIFTPNTYRVEYDYGGGKVSQEKSYTVTLHSDGTFRLPPDKSWEITVDKDNPLTVPVNYGSVVGAYYTWHTDENCETEPYDFSVPVTEDLNLYCKRHTSPYSQDAVNYGTSTGYYRTAGTFTTTQYYVIDGSKREYTVGSVLSFRTGSYVPYTVKAVNTVIYVYESALSYSAFEGAGVYTDSNGRGQYVAEIEKIFDVGTVIKVQTTFTVQERSGSGITDFYTFMSDINRQIKLEINGENGTTQGVSEWRYNNIVFGDAFGKLPVAERFGYDFVGWMYDGKLYTAQSCMDIASDITLLAKYNLLYSYVQYELSGGVNDTDNPVQYSVEDGIISLSPATKEGYRFMGWYLDEDYSREILSFDYATFSDGLTIYARFEKLYNVTYVLPDYAAAMETDTRIASEYFVPEWLEDVADADSEYRFAGWYADADYTELVTAISDRAEDVVLYAKFVPLYHVTAHTDGGELTASIPKYTAEDVVELNLIEAKKDNYIFLGWYSDAEFQTKIETIPAGTTYNVEIYAKYVRGTSGLIFTLNSDSTGYMVSAKGVSLGEKDVIIPAEYKDLPVLRIISFENQSTITSVSIPQSVKQISPNAFRGCSSLQSMTLPFVGDSIKTASDTNQYPFGYIFSTTSFTGSTSAFQEYYVNSTTRVSESFYIPTSLTSVTITGGNILYGAFYNCKNIQNIILTNGVESIENKAFYECTSLTSITIPGTIVSIQDKTFEGCDALESLYYEGDIAGWCEFKGLEYLNKDKVYIGEQKLTEMTSIVIPEGVTRIGNSAFYNCTSLTSITIPASVTNIEIFAFMYCPIENATLPSTAITHIKNSNLKTVVIIGEAAIGSNAFSDCASLTNVTISDGINGIGNSAFSNCTSLTSIDIPNSVVSIGDSAFEGCSNLSTITFEQGSSLNSIGQYAFLNCTSLKTITIPDSVTSKGIGVFNGCFIEEATIPSILAGSIGNENLKAVVITSGEEISSGALRDCPSLTSVRIAASVVWIKQSAFSGCSNLETIIFDKDSQLSGFFNGAFLNCDSITTVYFGGTKEEWNKISKTNAEILLSATCYYYSESNPFEGEGAVTEDNFWHYTEDGKTPEIWSKETV